MKNSLLLKFIFSLFLISYFGQESSGQFYRYINPEIEQKIDTIVAKMGTSEKIALLSGYKSGKIKGFAEYGLADIKTGSFYFYPESEAGVYPYPASLTLGASWDSDLAFHLGRLTARTARKHGYGALIGPDINLYRHVLDRGNETHFSEDSYLSGYTATALIKGVQSEKVMAFPTGFIADYPLYSHKGIQIEAEERAIEEVFLVPYRMAIDKGKAAGVVVGKATIGKEYLPQSELYITDILKGECLMEGIAIAPSTGKPYSGKAAARAGIDMELPITRYFTVDSLQEGITTGKLTQGLLDDKVERILRMLFHYEQIKGKQTIVVDTPLLKTTPQLNLEIARGSIVLLENKGILPISADTKPTIALIGPYANTLDLWDERNFSGKKVNGELSFSEAMFIYKPEGVKVLSEKGFETVEAISRKNEFYTNNDFQTQGLNADYFDGIELDTNPTLSEVTSNENGIILSSKHEGLNTHAGMSARWVGVMENLEEGEFRWFCTGSGGWRMYVDDSLLIDAWEEGTWRTHEGKLTWNQQGVHSLKIEYFSTEPESPIFFGYEQNPSASMNKALQVAKRADIVVMCLGYGPKEEQYGRGFELPESQKKLLQEVLAVNKKVIVVLQGGGEVKMDSWADSATAILHTFYPTIHTGQALTEILFGKVNPSGRLPISLARKAEDNPAYHGLLDTDKDGRVTFTEGWMPGYKYYITEEDALQPRYPFGFGLSYTNFAYFNLSVEPNNYMGIGDLSVRFEVLNTGKTEGADVPQIYLRDVQSALPRPARELKGYTKISLKPGESRTVTLTLSPEDLAYYHQGKKQWVTENGVFEILLGKNSADIQLKAPFVYSGEKIYKKRRRR